MDPLTKVEWRMGGNDYFNLAYSSISGSEFTFKHDNAPCCHACMVKD